MTGLLTGLMSVVCGATPEIIPPPQRVEPRDGPYTLPAAIEVSVPRSWQSDVEPFLWLIRDAVRDRGRFTVELLPDAPATTIVVLRDPAAVIDDQSYELTIGPAGVRIDATTPGGVFNALATLAQWIEQSPADPPVLPAAHIRDWPHVRLRAVHVDLTCRQYTAAYVQRLLRMLARYKVNAILLEYADMFPFQRHADIRRPDAFTMDDVRAIRATARACNQKIIPFVPCLAHMEYVLHREPYARYAATDRRNMVCPGDPETLGVLRELLDDVLTQHPEASYVHIGGDEVDEAQVRQCRGLDPPAGFDERYVCHVARLDEHLQRRQVTAMIWSDMVIRHPEMLAKLPRTMAIVDWDYGVTRDPTPAVWHGADVKNLDALSAQYLATFGAAVGVPQAAQRGGLVAYGHAAAFAAVGNPTFVAPAARSGGDAFDLPRYQLHMENIRIAFRRAAALELPGGIVTSWSYRLAPHEVCLPEYACVAYGWNTATPDVPELLARFFRQRYGVTDAELPAAVLAESEIVPASTVARTMLDDARRAWVWTPESQLAQIREAAAADRDICLATHAKWLDRMAQDEAAWTRALASASRNADELRYWALSRRLRTHRLRLVPPMIRLAAIAYHGAAADAAQIETWSKELAAQTDARTALRGEWEAFYRDAETPACLAVDLADRFDAERQMVDTLLADVKKR